MKPNDTINPNRTKNPPPPGRGGGGLSPGGEEGYARIFLSLAKRGRESTFGSCVSPWIRGSA